jgi:hypothetical protein
MRLAATAILVLCPAMAAADLCDGLSASGATQGVEEARLIIEYNATDDDIGVHGYVSTGAWAAMCLAAPDGTILGRLETAGPLGDLGLDTMFFESREPPAAEWDYDDLRAAFAEGSYRIAVQNVDGSVGTATARFTTLVPTPPEILGPPIVDDEEEAEAATVPADAVAVSWAPVTTSLDGRAPRITGYQVIVTKEGHADPDGFSKPIFDVRVGPEVTRLPVPAAFFDAGEIYELEVLALEASGNQTISVGFFMVE